MAATIISTLGVLFAAVAAWGAVRTVQLTRQMHVEDRLRRLDDAILSTIIAARAAQPSMGHPPAPSEKLEHAIADLIRCLPTVMTGTTHAVSGPIEQIVNMKDPWKHATQVMLLALQAQRALFAERDGLLNPNWIAAGWPWRLIWGELDKRRDS